MIYIAGVTKQPIDSQSKATGHCEGLGRSCCRGPSKLSVQKSNFKLVIRRPESDSLVTQLEIWAVVAYSALQELLIRFG